MRSNEQRVAETKRRIAEIERKTRRRRSNGILLAAAAACLTLIVGVSLAMPGLAAQLPADGYAGSEMAAGIFHGSAALGYIVIGLLAFLLGVCLTVLCFRLRQLHRQDKESEGRHGAD